MPRPNRYHPYIRQQKPKPAVVSPRYPPPPSIQPHQGMPTISEQGTVRPFQYIYPGYIRGTTSDGRSLIAKQILQAPDGMFHIQMQLVRFPSEDVRQHLQFQQSRAQGPPSCMPPPPMPMPIDPTLAGMGVKRESPLQSPTQAMMRNDSAYAGSDRSGSECAIISGDEDEADVDIEEEQYQLRAIMEQRKIMAELTRQRKQAGGAF